MADSSRLRAESSLPNVTDLTLPWPRDRAHSVALIYHEQPVANLWTERLAPSLGDIVDLAETAFTALPASIRAAAADVSIHVEDFAGDDLLESMGIENPFELSGLYDGVNRLDRSQMSPTPAVSRVVLFRRPILDEWTERGDLSLGDLVSHILIHEIGHHMGFSDGDIDALLEADD